MPILFGNVGWMERYQGLHSGDQIRGGGAYVKKEGRGHEICNFSPSGNKLYGYVQPHGEQIDIERIGANSDADSLSGVTVVWTATRPTGGTTVVGWYSNATVFRNYKRFKKAPPVQSRNGVDGYWIEAPANRAKLLPVDERTLEVPRQVRGGMGQSNIWYADSPQSAPLVKRIVAAISGKFVRRRTGGSRGRKQDQERKAKIEKAAIRACCDHFESLGYEVVSVEKDNLGWDLQAKSGRSTLRIEVKGLSGTTFLVDLTSNEYQAFMQQADDYRLAVVLNALKTPELSICRYSQEQDIWLVEGRGVGVLDVEIKQSASIKRILMGHSSRPLNAAAELGH